VESDGGGDFYFILFTVHVHEVFKTVKVSGQLASIYRLLVRHILNK
jgi:hypothetical protein